MKRVLVMLAAAVAVASCPGKKQAETTVAQPQKVLTKTVPAVREVIEQNEEYTSEIEPYKENDITPAASGVHIDLSLIHI